jgi:serine/threonine protein kinase/Tol biopolymer transport system component
MALEKNSLLNNRYRILEILGQGGMGSVYRAVDENLGATVALKENLFPSEEYARQFRLEATILANLRHPNLPRVSDHFAVGEQGQYLIMDFIEGEDLRQRMERVGTISDEDAVQIGASICDALAFLHSRTPPILHRDIKPGNVKIAPDGHIFLVDFGLAKLVDESGKATTTGARAMTPGYSPPEQYGTARTDARTDIYSLGATLYASLCGIIPEDGLARAMDNAQLTPLRKRNGRVSRRLAAAIEKAMAVDPSDRFQSVGEFKEALLNSKSFTQQTVGEYRLAPPPPELELRRELHEADTDLESRPRPRTGPVPAAPQGQEQPFVSPLKRQKERERRRRLALVRYFFLLLALSLVGVMFFIPGGIPDRIRNSIPFLARLGMPTQNVPAGSTETATPAFTSTFTPLPPTATETSTITPTPLATGFFIPPSTEALTTTPTLISTSAATPVGGGSGQIAYASGRNRLPQIVLADLATGDWVQLTNMPGGACQPSWSPVGTHIVFISPCSAMDELYRESSLYIMDADGENISPIPTVPGGDFDPAWSPEGDAIAFTSLRTGQMEIFLWNLEQATVTQLTKGAPNVESRQPAWSPDGSQIVYTVKRLGVYQVWLMLADGLDQKQIVRSGTSVSDYLPTWSYDGQLILFNQRCAVDICPPYLMRISGIDRSEDQGARLQFSALSIEDVEYSADGFWLVFEGAEADGNLDIYTMTVTGANRTRLTVDDGLDFDPTWRPLIR